MSNNSRDKCAKCGRTRVQIEQAFEKARRDPNVVVIGGSDVLLHCKNCEKSFCGACQVDLGWQGAGCPICRAVIG